MQVNQVHAEIDRAAVFIVGAMVDRVDHEASPRSPGVGRRRTKRLAKSDDRGPATDDVITRGHR
jgi:hypothetical protein